VYGSYEDTSSTLEKAVAPGPYILGAEFSAADVYVGSQIGFSMMMKVFDSRPAFVEYFDRLQRRPAYQRVMKKSDEVSAKMKKPA